MNADSPTTSTNSDAAASWQRLAEQRDDSLREQERLIASLETTIDRLQSTQSELAAANHRLRAELIRLFDEVAAERHTDAATRATLAYRAAVRLRNWFPVGSRAGTLARKAMGPFVRRDTRPDASK